MPYFKVLEGELARIGVKKKNLAEAMGISAKALSNKLSGRVAFSWPEVQTICNRYFPGRDIAELFATEDCCPEQSPILGAAWSKITVIDQENGKEIAVITNNIVTTASERIVVKLTPEYD